MAKKQSTAVLKFDDVKVIWRTILQNWYVPVILVPLLYLIGYFVAYRQFEIYQVSTQLLLKNNDQYYKEDVINETNNFYSAGSYVNNSNEIRVIKSYNLIEKVVDRLKSRLQVSYYIVGRVRTSEQFNGMPFLVYINSINPGLNEHKFSFKITGEHTYEIGYREGEKEVKKQGVFGKELIDSNSNFNLLINKSNDFGADYVKEIQNIQYEFVPHSLERLVAIFQSKLQIVNPDYTNVLTISYDDNLVERAKLFLDTLSRIYIDNTLKTRFALNERTIQYIDKQMSDIFSIVKYFEDTLQNYKARKAILDLPREESSYFERMTKYEEDRTVLNLQIKGLNDLEKYIIEDKDPQFLPPSAFVGSTDPFLTKEATHLYNLQIQMNENRNANKEKNPATENLANTIKKTKQDLLVYINNQRNACKQTMENIEGEIANYVGNIKTIPQKQRDILGIQRQLTVNEGLYNFLLEKRANTYIARASIIPETKVIESPRPTGRVYPDKQKIIMQYVFAGAIISLLIVLLRFFFFTTIQDVIELKELTGTPVIGDLVFVKKLSPTGIIVDEEPKSHIAESFRTLRTNLQYLNTMPGPKIILLTSNAPGEGKTFCSINLSTMLAKGGKKVLLLELDLHKPRVQKALEMTAEIGI
ncbi:MAG: GumC family protein, partial [Bacteroidia bacterium]